jgi:glycosyltransferase involved in cell wall biosynthesis
MPDTAEIMHDRGIADLPAFLAERGGQYDVIWVGRTHNLDSIAEILRDAFAGGERRPRIVLDTEAIAALRDASRAALPEFSGSFDRDAAFAREFANASLCDRVVAVSAEEAGCLESLGFGNVAVLGHAREIRSTPRPFQDRGGILFVGAIHEAASPNYDSLCWFADRVLPLVEEALGWETRLTIAGYVGENVDMGRFRGHPRITLRGMIAELEPLYDAHRLFVAPTRFAAGIPYKVYEAASYGLPVVASELLRRQTGWKDGSELLAADIADPALFAERIVTLYRDETLWRNLRENALARLRAENSPERYAEAIAAILAGEAAPASPGLDADLAASKPGPTVD